MIAIETAIKRIRLAIHDYQHVNYSDEEILDVINAGVRFIRRTIADIQPEILMSEQTGTLQAGENTIELEKRPLTIIEVTAGDSTKEFQLYETNLQHLRNKKYPRDRARIFYRVGLQTLKVFPVPKLETKYTVRMIADFEELTTEDETPLLNDFDDFLIEYATMRLSIDNEYDATQEQQILAAIQSQIGQVLSPPPTSAQVRGYW